MKTRILVVDDNQMFRDGLKQLINREADMEVAGEAENGQKAVALARELQPDVILMEIKMPVMDGVETTRRILSENPHAKILALSMYSDDGFRARMISAGALEYVIKGGDFEELSGAIRRVAGSGNF
jgi:DNA-binding NarL/FixJ family response regulator